MTVENAPLTRRIYGYLSNQGTAMAETAYCGEHMENIEYAKELAVQAGDAGIPLEPVEVTNNEMMFCMSCGINGYGDGNSELW